MRFLTYLISVFLSDSAAAATQIDSTHLPPPPYFMVDTIIVSGNERTKDYVILDEMTIKPGSPVTPEEIEYDRGRIYSLGLFTKVDIMADSLEGKRFLFVQVGERWYLIPQLVFGFRDGDPKRPYYGAGLLDYNFRGRDQKLSGLVVFGYNPSLSFNFRDPLIDRDQRLFFSCSASYSRIRNRSELESAVTGDFDEEHYNVNATIGKRFSLFENVSFNAGYEIVSVNHYTPARTASPTGRDAYLYGSLGYIRDTRDLREYPTEGSVVSGSFTKYGFGEGKLSFSRVSVDLRKYVPLPHNFTIGGRTYGSFAFGTFVPSPNRVFFGYGEKIRGHMRETIEGENLAGATVELHWPLLSTRTIQFSAIPLPAEFSVWRFGVGLALFADVGTAWFRGTNISANSFSSGYGGGIHFLLPYSFVMRTEFALNEYGKGQFILDFRTSI
jgi:outer membrane protein assembly factor BamA